MLTARLWNSPLTHSLIVDLLGLIMTWLVLKFTFQAAKHNRRVRESVTGLKVIVDAAEPRAS